MTNWVVPGAPNAGVDGVVLPKRPPLLLAPNAGVDPNKPPPPPNIDLRNNHHALHVLRGSYTFPNVFHIADDRLHERHGRNLNLRYLSALQHLCSPNQV